MKSNLLFILFAAILYYDILPVSPPHALMTRKSGPLFDAADQTSINFSLTNIFLSRTENK